MRKIRWKCQFFALNLLKFTPAKKKFTQEFSWHSWQTSGMHQHQHLPSSIKLFWVSQETSVRLDSARDCEPSVVHKHGVTPFGNSHEIFKTCVKYQKVFVSTTSKSPTSAPSASQARLPTGLKLSRRTQHWWGLESKILSIMAEADKTQNPDLVRFFEAEETPPETTRPGRPFNVTFVHAWSLRPVSILRRGGRWQENKNCTEICWTSTWTFPFSNIRQLGGKPVERVPFAGLEVQLHHLGFDKSSHLIH